MEDKDKLREFLLQAKESYVDKNKDRLTSLEPLWTRTQTVVPALLDIEPYIDFCDTKEKRDLWWYGRVTVSSAPLVGEVGRRFHYLIRDKSTGFVLGIVGLGSDLPAIAPRDNFIKWSKDAKWKMRRINWLLNVLHCISTPEFGNYLMGKLAALSVLSSEVQSAFHSKYGHNLAAMTVTSLYGKSSMYNRLEGFIYLGESSGYSTLLIPPELKQKMRDEYREANGKLETYYNDDGTLKEKYGVTKTYMKMSKYTDDIQKVENKRGVYMIPAASNYLEFLRGETDTLNSYDFKPFSTISDEWKTRWFLPRIERLNAC
jgi:hypothetical protein